MDQNDNARRQSFNCINDKTLQTKLDLNCGVLSVTPKYVTKQSQKPRPLFSQSFIKMRHSDPFLKLSNDLYTYIHP